MKTLTVTLATASLVLVSGCSGPTYKEELKILEQSYDQGLRAHEAKVSHGLPTGPEECEEFFNATDVSTKSYTETPRFFEQRKAHFLAGCQGLKSPSPDGSPSLTPTPEPTATPTDTPTASPTDTLTATPTDTPGVTPTDIPPFGSPSPSPTG